MDFTLYGWTPRLQYLADEAGGGVPARIISQDKGLYRVVSEAGELSASVSGAFRFHASVITDYPAVGDFVLLDVSGGLGVIKAVLPRASVFIRKASGTAHEEQVVAANVDTVFLCMALNNDFNLRRLERYLSVAWESGAMPVVALTKADLCEGLEARRREAESISMGADLLITSALESDGLSQIKPYLREGKTAAFLGSSGVGKSTLINRLLGEEKQETNGLRNDDKGRHTTTKRELLLLPTGGLVIDTPGMRELGMWDATGGVERAFSDITELAASCRFGDCTHTGEPGCAVRAAIDAGELSEERFASYRKLQAENAKTKDFASYLQTKEKKMKDIAKQNKLNQKK